MDWSTLPFALVTSHSRLFGLRRPTRYRRLLPLLAGEGLAYLTHAPVLPALNTWSVGGTGASYADVLPASQIRTHGGLFDVAVRHAQECQLGLEPSSTWPSGHVHSSVAPLPSLKANPQLNFWNCSVHQRAALRLIN